MRRNRMQQLLDFIWPMPSKHEIEEAGRRVWKRLEAELDKRDTSLRSLYGDGWSAPALDNAEFKVLSAAARIDTLPPTVCDIYEAVETCVGPMARPMIGVTLTRLQSRGLLTAVDSQPWRRFQLTEDGERALARARLEGKSLVSVGAELPCEL